MERGTLNVIRRACFLFLFFYFILYIFSTQFITAPIFFLLWKGLVPWFAGLTGYPGPIEVIANNGSGDTTYDYYSVLLFAVLAVVLALAAVFTIRKVKPFSTVLVVLHRYYLAYQMILYGFAKIFYPSLVVASRYD